MEDYVPLLEYSDQPPPSNLVYSVVCSVYKHPGIFFYEGESFYEIRWAFVSKYFYKWLPKLIFKFIFKRRR
jgi:hypothetical protein